jgi:hypothetical protein
MNYYRVQENYICDASNKLINGIIRKKKCLYAGSKNYNDYIKIIKIWLCKIII